MARAQAALRANKEVNIAEYKDATSRRDKFFSCEMYPDDLAEDTAVINIAYVSIKQF
jgi:hypothetical protein